MINHISDCAELNNGVKMPWLGLGLYKIVDSREMDQAIHSALETGYRSIDTAALYENEAEVGAAIKRAGIPRDELFITTKVWNDDQGYESTLRAFDDSRKKLGLDYVDLYLIHWPVTGKYKQTWKAIEKLYKDGWVRAIGVSNFNIHHLVDILTDCEIKPMVNQVEFHPRLIQEPLRHFCQNEGIQLEAWSPLMRGQLFDHPIIGELALKYEKSPAQIILRWDLQHEVITIPKSVQEQRIKENANIFDFNLLQEDMLKIDSLNKNVRIGPDPDTF